MTLTLRSIVLLSALAVMAGHAASPASAAPSFTTLHRFNGVPSDGNFPQGPLVFDASGALFGTTFYGGLGCAGGCGTVFKLAPPARGQTAWRKSVLLRFGDAVARGGLNFGISPRAGLTLRAGELYGTNTAGGNTAALILGTVFKLSPPKAPATKWTPSALYRFSYNGAAGHTPIGGVRFDSAGVLYGTNSEGGARDEGTVFKLTRSGITWRPTVLHAFRGGTDGASPQGDLAAGPDGSLYGTTFAGGTRNAGTIFRLRKSGSSWLYSKLFEFRGGNVPGQTNNGSRPKGRLVVGSDGSIFGTTAFGGSANQGTVFKLAKPAAGQTAWRHTILHHFTGPDGTTIHSGLTTDSAGLLYGSAAGGGPNGGGTIFRLARTGAQFKVLRTFLPRSAGGSLPFAAVTPRSGALYGTTGSGGTSNCGNGCGTVFKLVP